jgi:hypothetical protein
MWRPAARPTAMRHLWLIENCIPMDEAIKKILNGVVLIVVALGLLSAFGVLGPMLGIRLG